MRVVIISDTHIGGNGKLSDIVIPDGDMLIHCGDLTWRGTSDETKKALDHLSEQPHKYKIFIAGNHDFLFDSNIPSGHKFRSWTIHRPYSVQTMLERHGKGLIYLQDSGIEIEGFKIYGSPWQPWFYDWAFNFDGYSRGFHYPECFDSEKGLQQAKDTWAKIPDDTNILITHCPPSGILDNSTDGHRLGDRFLRKNLERLESLKLHCFGHIHKGYGTQLFKDLESEDEITFVNAAICDENYDPVNKPIVVNL